MKTILISGGLGYLAQNFIKVMNDDKYKFILVDNITNPNSSVGSQYITNICTDITEGSQLEKKLSALNLNQPLRIDGVLNTPAWNNFKSLSQISYDDIKKIITTKLIGYTNVIKSSLPYLSTGSSIVNVGSVQAHSTRQNTASYSAANGGVISLTKALATEFRKNRIRVNVVTAGGFDSDIYKKIHSDWKQRLKKGQCISTNEVSEVIKFLLSDKSRGVNGAEIIVDGGMSVLRASSFEFK